MYENTGFDEALKQLRNQWENMPANEAEDFYSTEIFPLVKKKFINEWSNRCSNYDYLILSLGFSYEPLVLTILALKPKKVLFLYTPDSLKNLDVVVKETGLMPSQFVVEEISKDDPVDIYRAIKKIYVDRWKSPKNAAIDFTGGTKAMSAGIAMAGAYFKMDLVYVASTYNSKMRKPEPGTERLEFVKNPYDVLGDLEKDKALSLFNNNEFASAFDIFYELELKAADRNYTFMKILSNIYRAWDNLNFNEAVVKLKDLLDLMDSWRPVEGNLKALQYYEALKKQYLLISPLRDFKNDKNVFSVLKDKDKYLSLLFTIYENAARRARERKYDTSILLLYRVLELIGQIRLARYDIDTARPDYSKLDIPNEEVLKKMNSVLEKGMKKINVLPENLSLLNDYILLKAIGDELCLQLSIGNLFNISQLRNSSVYAHGYSILSETEYVKFNDLVFKILNEFCRLEEVDFKQLDNDFQFIVINL
ncbi:TIGR02710 family CRISPR-associated CARF protein [Calorimonas adulescens]|nr:TIGR02710 family CRISPR-associated CARF protein [Calorimonas adulescens]